MAIEKRIKNGVVVSYRAKVYYKGKRFIGNRRSTKKEAELDEINKKRDLLTGNYLDETKKTLDQCFDDYLLLLAPKRLSFKALENTKSLYKKHIQPDFGFRLMTTIKPLEVQRLLTKKEIELANSTIIKIYTLLNQMYKMMINWGELKINPIDGVTKPRPNYKKKKTWTKEECHQFLQEAESYQSYPAFWLALQFGLRLGEVQGLQWKNIDLDNKILHVEQAYHEEEKKLGGLKTDASYRSISISVQQAHFLQEKKKQSSDNDLVAPNVKGEFLMKGNIRRAMEVICKRSRVPKITFHELRHTHATLLLEMNEHPKIVQQRLGHVKVETTMDIYSHVRPQVNQESAQRFSDFFEK